MSKPLTVSVYNFTGVDITNLGFGGRVGEDTEYFTDLITVAPNTPDSPAILANGGPSYTLYYLTLEYPGTTRDRVVLLLPIDATVGTISVYFVNNNSIDFLKYLPDGGDITPYLYSSNFQPTNASIAYQTQYAPASSFAFDPAALVVAVPANKEINSLTKVTEIDWSPEAIDSNWSWWPWIILAIMVIVAVIIAIIAIMASKKEVMKETTIVKSSGGTMLSWS